MRALSRNRSTTLEGGFVFGEADDASGEFEDRVSFVDQGFELGVVLLGAARSLPTMATWSPFLSWSDSDWAASRTLGRKWPRLLKGGRTSWGKKQTGDEALCRGRTRLIVKTQRPTLM